MTNYERIKEMSVSALAELLMNNDVCSCCINYNLPLNVPSSHQCYVCDDGIAKAGIMQWLISEVEE